jgi:stringent starvation protein B
MADPKSTKPYLMRALYEWCVDNGLTPYISVVVDGNTRVPREYVRNGEIVLNIGPLAAHRLKIGNELVELSARFGGVARDLAIPVAQVAAIYARENGHGMSFEIDRSKATSEEGASSVAAPPASPEPPEPQGGGKPTLRIVK